MQFGKSKKLIMLTSKALLVLEMITNHQKKMMMMMKMNKIKKMKKMMKMRKEKKLIQIKLEKKLHLSDKKLYLKFKANFQRNRKNKCQPIKMKSQLEGKIVNRSKTSM